jgi:hypothetical protein
MAVLIAPLSYSPLLASPHRSITTFDGPPSTAVIRSSVLPTFTPNDPVVGPLTTWLGCKPPLKHSTQDWGRARRSGCRRSGDLATTQLGCQRKDGRCRQLRLSLRPGASTAPPAGGLMTCEQPNRRPRCHFPARKSFNFLNRDHRILGVNSAGSPDKCRARAGLSSILLARRLRCFFLEPGMHNQ